MTPPVVARTAVRHAGGRYVGSAVAALVASLRDPGRAETIVRWAQDPAGRLVVAALDAFAANPPWPQDDASALVQYGMTQGLLFARQMLVDPTVVLDFAGPAPESPSPVEPDYEATPDGIAE